MKWCKITGNFLEQIQRKIIKNKNVMIIDVFDDIECHPVFPNTQNLYLRSINKNYMYKCINKKNFPDVKNIYLFTIPFEPYFFSRFSNESIYIPVSLISKNEKITSSRFNVFTLINFKIDDTYLEDIIVKE